MKDDKKREKKMMKLTAVWWTRSGSVISGDQMVNPRLSSKVTSMTNDYLCFSFASQFLTDDEFPKDEKIRIRNLTDNRLVGLEQK